MNLAIVQLQSRSRIVALFKHGETVAVATHFVEEVAVRVARYHQSWN